MFLRADVFQHVAKSCWFTTLGHMWLFVPFYKCLKAAIIAFCPLWSRGTSYKHSCCGKLDSKYSLFIHPVDAVIPNYFGIVF